MCLISPETIVKVIMVVSLASLSCCRYIGKGENAISSSPSKIARDQGRQKICGTTLADIISAVCGGKFNSPWRNNPSSHHIRSKRQAASQCCLQGCTRPQLEEYCEQPVTTTASSTTERENNIREHSQRLGMNAPDKSRAPKSNSIKDEVKSKKVSVKRKKRRGKKARSKRKKPGCFGKFNKRHRVFKRICYYPSFGHYLLNVNADVRVRNDFIKKNNSTVLPMQTGTIPPSIDNLGGPPLVVPPGKHKPAG